MKMNKLVLQRGIIFILCICILFSVCPVYAFAAENQKELSGLVYRMIHMIR